jgi:hypothetical protein
MTAIIRLITMNKLKCFILAITFGMLCIQVHGQNDVASVVSLDEFVVSARIDGFDVQEFIDQVRNDTTFYKAFLNLKYFPHELKGAMVVYNKNESEKGTMKRKAKQHLSPDEMMHVEITYDQTNGNVKNRKGEWKYLTAEMYDDIFFPSKPAKVSNLIQSTDQELVSGSKLEKHKAQLKRMMFNPGAEIENVPFIGDKMAIFESHMVPYYDYGIFLAMRDSVECIAFSCLVKPGMEGKVVIQDLTSYFDIETKEVMAREYRLAHNTLIFDFDIRMKIDNIQQGGWLLPEKVWYSGYWNAAFMKREIITFELQCTDYKTNVGRYSKSPEN